MFKVGDIVEITEKSSATGMLDFVDGKGYTVKAVYDTTNAIMLLNESLVARWYHYAHFKLKGVVKVEKKECLFKEGQVVWDVVRGEGVVTDILKWEEYPVIVEFDGEEESYTADGKYREDYALPSLYPYEPKIVKADGNEDTSFFAVFEDGDLVQVKFVGSEEIHDTVFVVEKETKDAIYMKGNHFFLKSQISNIYYMTREEIELELANTL